MLLQVNQPAASLRAHGDKVSIIKFSPTARDIVATAAFDWTVKIWNLETAEVGHVGVLGGQVKEEKVKCFS